MALIALKISSFLLPLNPFPFPSSSKCYGETVALASVPSSLLLVRPGFGSHLEGGGMLFHLLGSLFSVCCGSSLSALVGWNGFTSSKALVPYYLQICVPEDNSKDGNGSQGGGFSDWPRTRDWTNVAVVEICIPTVFFQNNPTSKSRTTG